MRQKRTPFCCLLQCEWACNRQPPIIRPQSRLAWSDCCAKSAGSGLPGKPRPPDVETGKTRLQKKNPYLIFFGGAVEHRGKVVVCAAHAVRRGGSGRKGSVRPSGRVLCDAGCAA